MERYSHLQTLPNSPLTPLTPLCDNTAFDFNFGGDGSLDVYIDNIRHKYEVEKELKSPIPTKKDNEVLPRRYSDRFLKIRDVFEPASQQRCKEQDQLKQFEVPQCRVHLKDPPKKLCCNETPKESQQPAKQHIVHHKDCQILRQQQQLKQRQQVCQKQQSFATPHSTVKITHTGATPSNLHSDYVATPKYVRTPLKQRNYNIALNQPQKLSNFQQMQLQKQQQYRAFLQTHLGSSAKRATVHSQPFRLASPVALKPLSPRVSKILHHGGLAMYCGLFQREEIDLFSFKLLQLHDLQQMGITDAKHCDIILAETCYARQYL